jgi:hypothetical protein
MTREKLAVAGERSEVVLASGPDEVRCQFEVLKIRESGIVASSADHEDVEIAVRARFKASDRSRGVDRRSIQGSFELRLVCGVLTDLSRERRLHVLVEHQREAGDAR